MAHNFFVFFLLFFSCFAYAETYNHTSAVSFCSTEAEKKIGPNGLPQTPGFYCITGPGGSGSSHDGSSKCRNSTRARSHCALDISKLSHRQAALLYNSSPAYRELIKNGAKIISYRDLAYQKLSREEINLYPTVYCDNASGALIQFHPLHLVHNPRACAHWTLQTYWEGLGTLFADLYSVDEDVSLRSEYKYFGCSDTFKWYVHDSCRYAIVQQWPLYDYPAFWEFLKQYPDYQQCIIAVQDLINRDESVRNQLSAQAREKIAVETTRIIAYHQAAHARAVQEQHRRDEEARLAARKQQQEYEQKLLQEEVEKQEEIRQLEMIQDLLRTQYNCLESQQCGNKNRLQHLRNGFVAVQTVINGNDVSILVTRELNNKAIRILHDLDIDAQEFVSCFGNAIVTAKHEEIIDITNTFGELSVQPNLHKFSSIMCGFANNAQTCNKSGDIKEASAIADFCWDMLECSQAFTGGIFDGIKAIGYSIGDLATKPRATIKHAAGALKRAAAFIEDIIMHAEYFSDECETQILSQFAGVKHNYPKDELEAYTDKLVRMGDALEAAGHRLNNKLSKMSVPEKLRMCTSLGVELCLTPVVYDKLLRGAGLLCRQVAPYIKEALQRIPNTVPTEHLLMCAEGGAEVEATLEATKIFEKAAETESKIAGITGGGKNIGNIIPKFAELDAAIGDLAKLERAAEAIKNIEGAEKLLETLYKTGHKGGKVGGLGTARGAAYEIEKAYDLMQKGEEIVEIGKILIGSAGRREFDIATRTKLIECKNIDWAKKVSDPGNKMGGIFGEQAKIARECGKIFEIHSKQPIPGHWKDWFNEKNIIFVEG
ncbi:MAG TPA: hypothetical protein VGT41_01960 [Candidatus Babeliales bacterium]|nr:hypothetical protein [Candidatus Babeliales bacterium]